MAKNSVSVPVSTFARSTTFAIEPNRIGLLESAYEGCIEVHLANYDYNTKRTLPGGSGVTLSGNLQFIRERWDVYGRKALIAGFDEVFEPCCQYEGVLVLRPLGLGLGVDWELYRSNARRTSRKRRMREKYASLAAKHLDKARQHISRLTGRIDRPTPLVGGPFKLREETNVRGTQNWPVTEEPLTALTVHEARLVARKRIATLRRYGWTCGQESCFRGRIEREKTDTVAWLCQRWNIDLRVSVECGVPKHPLPTPVVVAGTSGATKGLFGNRYGWLKEAITGTLVLRQMGGEYNGYAALGQAIEQTLKIADTRLFATALVQLMTTLEQLPKIAAADNGIGLFLETCLDLTAEDLLREGYLPEDAEDEDEGDSEEEVE